MFLGTISALACSADPIGACLNNSGKKVTRTKDLWICCSILSKFSFSTFATDSVLFSLKQVCKNRYRSPRICLSKTSAQIEDRQVHPTFVASSKKNKKNCTNLLLQTFNFQDFTEKTAIFKLICISFSILLSSLPVSVHRICTHTQITLLDVGCSINENDYVSVSLLNDCACIFDSCWIVWILGRCGAIHTLVSCAFQYLLSYGFCMGFSLSPSLGVEKRKTPGQMFCKKWDDVVKDESWSQDRTQLQKICIWMLMGFWSFQITGIMMC